jgi:uncharacterized protein (DUF486 family)
MPALLASPYVLTILMLLGSNIFMTIAWYGHLRFKEVPLAGVIVASWLIAFVEYCLAVPANRWGSEVYTTAQLKTIQEVITLVVFAAFSVLYLKEPMTWNYAIGFVLVASGAFHLSRPALTWRHRHGAALGGAANALILPIFHLVAMVLQGSLPQS